MPSGVVLLRAVFALLSMGCAAGAPAQISGSVAVVSDYRYRGVSLSSEKPAVQAGLAYDHDSGWYAGASASTAALGDQERTGVLAIAYAGFAHRLGPTLSWDAGASYTTFSGGGYDYAEVHAGLAADKLNLKIHYAPNYYGFDARALYAEVNGAWPVRDRLSLFGHIGALHLSHRAAPAAMAKSTRIDTRFGVELDLDWARLQLAWVTASVENGPYSLGYNQSRNVVVASLSRAF